VSNPSTSTVVRPPYTCSKQDIIVVPGILHIRINEWPLVPTLITSRNSAYHLYAPLKKPDSLLEAIQKAPMQDWERLMDPL
jgi:hypothetical protein